MSKPVKARPLLTYVLALALTLTLPPFILLAVTTSWLVSSEQARLQAGTHQLTEDALGQVDQYLVGIIAMLQALATSPAIDAGDFERLDGQARELRGLQKVNVVLRDLTGQQVVNIRLPWGSALPRSSNTDADRHVAETRRPYVADIYPGLVAERPLIRVVVPVLRSGNVIYTLTANPTPHAFAGLLEQAGIAAPFSASIADRQGRLIARTDHDDALVGRTIPDLAHLPSLQGTWSGTSAQGVPAVSAYRRSPLSGWIFAVSVDPGALNAPLYRSLWGLGALAALLGLLATGASVFVGRKMVTSQRQLAAAAETLGKAQVVEAPQTAVHEANVIAEALAGASIRLREQASALTAANRELEERVDERTRELSTQAALLQATMKDLETRNYWFNTALSNMSQGLCMFDARRRLIVCNRRYAEMYALPPAVQAAGTPLRAILEYRVRNGSNVAETDPQHYIEKREAIADAGERLSFTHDLVDGRAISVLHEPMAGGGWVATHEDITERRRIDTQIAFMARHDALTGLPNRTLLRECMDEAVASARKDGKAFALLCLDLDGFKTINDTLGHPTGDALLREVAQRLCACVGESGTVARLGGDEFAILQTAEDQPREASTLAESIILALGHPYDLDGNTVIASTSVGVALSPGDGTEPDLLFRKADLALYRSKEEGGGTCRFFEPSMDAQVQARRALELDLRNALSNGELELYYQPVVSFSEGEVTGFEALLRWRHPQRGFVSPAEFIQVAEEIGLIGSLGEWVLRKACAEAAAWPSKIKVAVNLSPKQFSGQNHLSLTVVSALAAAGLQPNRLELEITESVLLADDDSTLATLHGLRDMGVSISLDDFGTGYSSLSYLRKFPFDKIKIDQSFVRELSTRADSLAIVQGVAALATSLGMTTTAEGVETREQFDQLRAVGCTEAQGYFFSRPMPAREVAHLVETCREVLGSAA